MTPEGIQSKAAVQKILALTLYHYQESELNMNQFSIERLNNDEFDINIGIVLPPEEGCVDIKPYIVCKHDFILSTDEAGHTIPITYDFSNATMSNRLFDYSKPGFKKQQNKHSFKEEHMKEKLIIAIDPGFSDYKIVINGSLFKFSSKMLDYTNSSYGADRRPAGSYYVRLEKEILKEGEEQKETLKGNRRVKDLEYLIGNVTETAMSSADVVTKNRHLLEILQALSKFPTEEFKISLQGALALALYQYQQSEENTGGFTIERLNNDEYDVYLGIALPQDYVAQKGVIKPHLSCKHNFKLYVTDQDIEIPITYDLSDSKYMADSQVKCAFLYQFTDDFGNDVEDFWDNLPCFVVDGGYHTFGMFYLTKDLTTPVCESNLEFAMYKVDTSVATEVTTKISRTNFSAVQVKEYLKNKQSIKYGKQRLDYKELQKIYDEKRKAAASNSIKAMVKLVEMDDCNSLLLTGGTGAAYYDVYQEYFKENYGDNLVPILTDKPFNGKKIDPVYAVALGLYKQLHSAVEANSAEGESA